MLAKGSILSDVQVRAEYTSFDEEVMSLCRQIRGCTSETESIELVRRLYFLLQLRIIHMQNQALALPGTLSAEFA